MATSIEWQTKKALGYIRVSTDKQAEKGMSLEAQEARLHGWAAMKGCGYELVGIESDSASAKSLDRPAFNRVMSAVDRREVDAVVVVKLDRLTRSVHDLAVLMERFNDADVEFASITETLDSHTAAGRMVMNIIATVGQWERETISERTREAMQHIKRKGGLAGNVPYGKRRVGFTLVEGKPKGGTLEDEPSEQIVLRRIRELREMGETHRGITETLNAEGFKTRKGTEWKHQYIANLVGEK